MSWFSQIWRKAGPQIAAAAAIASGQPELAAPAAAAAGATIKPKKPAAPVQPVAMVPAGGGFRQAYADLSQADREIVVVGGAVVGTVLLYRLLAGGGRR